MNNSFNNNLIFLFFLLMAVMCMQAGAAKAGLFDEAVSGEEEMPPELEQQVSVAQVPSNYELNGFIRGDLFIGKTNQYSTSEVKMGYGELGLQFRAKKGDFASGFADMRYRYGAFSGTTTGYLDLKEAYVDLYLGDFDIRLGHQIILWGRADGVNPTNNITPIDMRVRSANFDDRRLGNWAVRGYYNANPWRLEMVWVPFYTPAQLPELEIPGPLYLSEGQWPDHDVRNGLGAAKLHLELPSIEASVSYTYGNAPFPGLMLNGMVIDAMSSKLDVAMRSFEQYVIGFDFATTLGDFAGLRGEAAFRRPVAYENKEWVPNPDVQYVLGIDKEFGGTVTIIAQYIGRYVIDFDDIDALDMLDSLPVAITPAMFTTMEPIIRQQILKKTRMIAGQTHELQHLASLNISIKLLHETMTAECTALFNFTNQEFMVRPMLSYELADALDVMIGGEIYGGSDDTLYGMIDESFSAGFIEVKASF